MEEIFTVPEAAQKLKISEYTLWALIKKGKVRCRKVGGSVRFTGDDLEASLVLHPASPQKPPRA